MLVYHNSRNSFCRFPFGAVKCGEGVTLRLMAQGGVRRVLLHMYSGGDRTVQMLPCGNDWYEAHLFAPDNPTLLWYDFQIEGTDGRRYYFGNARDLHGGEGSMYDDVAPGYQITVYARDYHTPDILHKGAMYQIFPDRFYKSKPLVTDRTDVIIHKNWNEEPLIVTDDSGPDGEAIDVFGGDLNGIREKLPYLQSLGVTVLYLNPIFKARSNHHYDTGDYNKIDPLFGTKEDFEALCADAKACGISVLLDGVFSHTGSDSAYFNKYGRYDTLGAYQSKSSPYYSWYKFKDYPCDYASWWGFKNLPELDKNNPSYQEFMCGENGVARSWIKAGAAGWRLDVADELPVPFLRKLRQAVTKENKDAVLLGEVWEDASNKVAYGQMRCYCSGDMLDSVMNYPLREHAIAFFTFSCNAYALVRAIESLQENYPVPFFYALMNLLGSHDRARIVNVLCRCDGEDVPREQRADLHLTPAQHALGEERYKKMLHLFMALPGIPCIYYGDEIGMEGATDPFCRRTFDWSKQDCALTQFVRDEIAWRKKNPVLETGNMKISALDADTIQIIRSAQNGKDVFGQPLTGNDVTVTIHR